MGKGKARTEKKTKAARTVSEQLRLPAGPVDLGALDARGTPGFAGDKAASLTEVAPLAAEISELQERLYAAGREGGRRRFLLVIQGIDTSGKGGTVRHVVGHLDPQGLAVKAFKAPTAEERSHDFLWRVRRALPEPGYVGVFDRSHYEDVLIARVRQLAPKATITRRYATINRFERGLTDEGFTLLKVMLHISRDEQKQRLLERLDDPTKHWKYNPGDVDERALWDDYQEAYRIALEKTNTPEAPWFVVPADRKWYRNWAINHLVLEHLRALDLGWPPADFDVELERKRVLNS